MTAFVNALFNTPLFYIVSLLLVIGFMYIVTKRDLARLQEHPQAFVKQDRQDWRNEPVTRKLLCAGCGHRLTPEEAYVDDVSQQPICEDCLDEFGSRRAHSFTRHGGAARSRSR